MVVTGFEATLYIYIELGSRLFYLPGTGYKTIRKEKIKQELFQGKAR